MSSTRLEMTCRLLGQKQPGGNAACTRVDSCALPTFRPSGRSRVRLPLSLGPRHCIGHRKMKPEHGRTVCVVNPSSASVAVPFNIEKGTIVSMHHQMLLPVACKLVGETGRHVATPRPRSVDASGQIRRRQPCFLSRLHAGYSFAALLPFTAVHAGSSPFKICPRPHSVHSCEPARTLLNATEHI